MRSGMTLFKKITLLHMNCLMCSSFMCVSTQWDICLNYLQDTLTKIFSLFALWKSCQNHKLNISQTEIGSPTSDCVLCSVSFMSTDRSPRFRLKTLDFFVYSTSFQGPETVLGSASSPTPLCLSSAPSTSTWECCNHLLIHLLKSSLSSL